MPKKIEEREYRAMPLVTPTENEYRAQGYATTFGDPYLLFRMEDVDYFEEVAPNAIDEKTDMSDVIFQFDHEGMVFARMSNGTLALSQDEHGLKVDVDLSKTADARNMFENISSGMVREMSWAFTVDGQKYDKETHTRKITHIRKIYCRIQHSLHNFSFISGAFHLQSGSTRSRERSTARDFPPGLSRP